MFVRRHAARADHLGAHRAVEHDPALDLADLEELVPVRPAGAADRDEDVAGLHRGEEQRDRLHAVLAFDAEHPADDVAGLADTDRQTATRSSSVRYVVSPSWVASAIASGVSRHAFEQPRARHAHASQIDHLAGHHAALRPQEEIDHVDHVLGHRPAADRLGIDQRLHLVLAARRPSGRS